MDGFLPLAHGEKLMDDSHYKQTRIEAIEVIDDWDLNFNLGNVIKYIARYKFKGGRADLCKALDYLERELQRGHKAE